MKGLQFFIRCLIVITIVAVLDLACHFVMDTIRRTALQAKPDNYEMTSYYGVEMATEELLVLGPSTATHHYIPSVLEDSLRLSARNIGKDGAFLYCQICQLSLILERYIPRLVIWDISDDCLSHNLDWGDFLEIRDYWPYPLNDFSKTVLKKMGPAEQFSIHSWLYRYNSKLPEYLFAFVSGRNSLRGYVPLPANTQYATEVGTTKVEENINPLKVELLEKILTLCREKGCQVVIVSSPRLADDGVPQSEQCRKLCEITERLGVPYFNYHQDPRFFGDLSLFRDVDHLNENGAALFTQCIIHDIQDIN